MLKFRVFNDLTKRWKWMSVSEDGSGQRLISLELTSVELAPYWDSNYLQLAYPIDDVEPGSIIQRVWERDNTLDEGISLQNLGFYLPNATATDIGDLGSYIAGAIAGDSSESEYVYGLSRGTLDAVLKEGAKAYIIFGGDAAPTEGETTIHILVCS